MEPTAIFCWCGNNDSFLYKLITFHSGEAKISALSFRNLRGMSSSMGAFVISRSFMKSGTNMGTSNIKHICRVFFKFREFGYWSLSVRVFVSLCDK